MEVIESIGRVMGVIAAGGCTISRIARLTHATRLARTVASTARPMTRAVALGIPATRAPGATLRASDGRVMLSLHAPEHDVRQVDRGGGDVAAEEQRTHARLGRGRRMRESHRRWLRDAILR
jgi:hypothetical protein